MDAAIPRAAKRGMSARRDQLDVLDAGHERRSRPTVGARASSAARTAASPMPWIWVAIPRRRARGLCAAARRAVISQTP